MIRTQAHGGETVGNSSSTFLFTFGSFYQESLLLLLCSIDYVISCKFLAFDANGLPCLV